MNELMGALDSGRDSLDHQEFEPTSPTVCTVVFGHFFYGYRKRESDVAKAVEQSPGQTCIVLDLKNFYPSVDKSRVRRRFQDRIRKTKTSISQKDAANYLVDQLLEFPEPGLPVG